MHFFSTIIEVLNTCVTTLVYCGGLPVLIPFAFVFCAICYALDKALSGIETATLWGRHSHTREPLDAVEYACQSREKNNLDPEVFNWEITGPGTT